MTNKIQLNRRNALTGIIASAALLNANPVLALSKSQADALVGSIVEDVMSAIGAGKSNSALFKDFEKIFAKYADVPLIAQKALGPTWKKASSSQRKAYVSAFRGYMSRYYGKRFQEFIGSEIKVTKSRKTSGGYLVDSTIKLKGSAPFKAQWHVINARGKPLMYNLFLEGVSVLSDVRVQIGSMLDKRGGDIDKLTSHLRSAG